MVVVFLLTYPFGAVDIYDIGPHHLWLSVIHTCRSEPGHLMVVE
jgi:hypothetical protein